MGHPVLVIAKKSFYEVYGLDRQDPHFLSLIKSDSELARDLISAYEDNQRAIEAVITHLDHEGIAWERGDVGSLCVDGLHSLVLSVGWDGTLLAASHRVLKTPVLGINSRPGVSVGFFCPVDSSNFQPLLAQILERRVAPRELMRMDTVINGQRLCPPALNDVLYTARNPASTTVYRIMFQERDELQKSAGVWISTPAGSTAGILAAGGRSMELTDDRMQFLVRECYCVRENREPLKQGMFRQGLKITNLTPEASVYVDGTRIVHPLHYGDVVEALPSQTPLSIFLSPPLVP